MDCLYKEAVALHLALRMLGHLLRIPRVTLHLQVEAHAILGDSYAIKPNTDSTARAKSVLAHFATKIWTTLTTQPAYFATEMVTAAMVTVLAFKSKPILTALYKTAMITAQQLEILQ